VKTFLSVSAFALSAVAFLNLAARNALQTDEQFARQRRAMVKEQILSTPHGQSPKNFLPFIYPLGRLDTEVSIWVEKYPVVFFEPVVFLLLFPHNTEG